jgi:hypothetical protein
MWFAAHVILVLKLKQGQQNEFPVWENVLLLEAPSAEGVVELATERAQQYVGDSDGSLTLDDRPAVWEFVGVRKVVLCDPSDTVADGTEATYSEFVLESFEDVQVLARGGAVRLTYTD